jgi:hypothetical protein
MGRTRQRDAQGSVLPTGPLAAVGFEPAGLPGNLCYLHLSKRAMLSSSDSLHQLRAGSFLWRKDRVDDHFRPIRDVVFGDHANGKSVEDIRRALVDRSVSILREHDYG